MILTVWKLNIQHLKNSKKEQANLSTYIKYLIQKHFQ